MEFSAGERGIKYSACLLTRIKIEQESLDSE